MLKNLDKNDNSWWASVGPIILGALEYFTAGTAKAFTAPAWASILSAGVGGYLGKTQDLKGAEDPLELLNQNGEAGK